MPTRKHRGLPSLPHLEHRPGDRDEQHHGEGKVGGGRRQEPRGARQHQQPRRQPQQQQAGQPRAVQRVHARPVLRRGEQESGDHGHGVTVDHFVRVPLEQRDPGELRRQAEAVGREPRDHGGDGKQAGAQEKRPETAGPERVRAAHPGSQPRPRSSGPVSK